MMQIDNHRLQTHRAHTLSGVQDICQQTVPDGYMYKDMMRLLAESGEYDKAIELVHQMYEITKREEILQFGESQLASIAGTMVCDTDT